MWTFGFDTVYAMADLKDDKKLGLNSSALSLEKNAMGAVGISYAISCIFLANGAFFAGINWPFWPVWILTSIGMQREVTKLNKSTPKMTEFGRHFQNQVWLGALLLLGLILAK